MRYRMRKYPVIAVLVLVILATTQWIVRSPWTFAQTPSDNPAIPIGATRVTLTQAQLSPTQPTIIRAFIGTGTLNTNCLATFAEASFPEPGMVLFCAPRLPAGLGKGVLVSVFYPSSPPVSFVVILTLYQEGAVRYNQPVLCNVDGC